jgi:hypothetical protein
MLDCVAVMPISRRRSTSSACEPIDGYSVIRSPIASSRRFFCRVIGIVHLLDYSRSMAFRLDSCNRPLDI